MALISINVKIKIGAKTLSATGAAVSGRCVPEIADTPTPAPQLPQDERGGCSMVIYRPRLTSVAQAPN